MAEQRSLQPFRQRQEEELRPARGYPATVPVTTVTNSNVTLFTVPDDHFFHVKFAAVENNGSGNLAITLHIVPSGGSADSTNRIYNAHVVAANTEEMLEMLMGAGGSSGHMLEPGDQIIAVTDDATDGGNFWLWGELTSDVMPQV